MNIYGKLNLFGMIFSICSMFTVILIESPHQLVWWMIIITTFGLFLWCGSGYINKQNNQRLPVRAGQITNGSAIMGFVSWVLMTGAVVTMIIVYVYA